MDKNKIKFKYLLGIWKTLSSYPTKEDIVYEIENYLIKEKKIDGEFTISSLNSIFGKEWEKTKHKILFDDMIGNEIIENDKNNKKNYKINKNGYI